MKHCYLCGVKIYHKVDWCNDCSKKYNQEDEPQDTILENEDFQYED